MNTAPKPSLAKVFASLFVALSAASLPQAHAQALLVRPYIQPGPAAGDGLDSKTIIWVTEPTTEGDFGVEYGAAGAAQRRATVTRTEIRLAAPTAEQLKKAHAATRPKGGEDDDHAVPVLANGDKAQHYVKYHAVLTDLPRDAAAWYRVRFGTQVISQQTFRTRATAGKPIRFVAVGDLANGKAGQNAIAYQASLTRPDFVVALGDIVYPTGRVSQYMDHFFRTYVNVDAPSPAAGAPLMASTPFYAVLGNHDVDTSLNVFPDCLGIYYFFHAPANGPSTARGSTPISRDKEQAARFRATAGPSYPALCAYSFDDGPAHFVVIDSNGYSKTDSPELLKWLEDDLTSSKARWKFVCQHAPAFHSSPAHYTEQKMRRLSPLLERCGVDVVFSGHVHNYQRSHPLRFEPAPPQAGVRLVNGKFTIDTTFDGAGNTRPKGIIHVVSGGGGGSLYKDPVTKTETLMRERYPGNWVPYTAKHIVDKHSFVVCDVTPNQLTLRAVDQDGKGIDRVIVTKDE